MLSVPLLSGENRGERLVGFESRSVKTQDAVEGFQFHMLENFHKLCQGFHQAIEAWRICLVLFTRAGRRRWCCLCSNNCKWLDFRVFSEKDIKP